MIRFKSDKIEKEWTRAAVALRLIAEALDIEAGGISVIFRVVAPEKFENGMHARGLALDMELCCSENEAVKACAAMNARFRARDSLFLTCILKVNRANMPSGARADRPHAHVQIHQSWAIDPRAFLKQFGFLAV